MHLRPRDPSASSPTPATPPAGVPLSGCPVAFRPARRVPAPLDDHKDRAPPIAWAHTSTHADPGASHVGTRGEHRHRSSCVGLGRRDVRIVRPSGRGGGQRSVTGSGKDGGFAWSKRVSPRSRLLRSVIVHSVESDLGRIPACVYGLDRPVRAYHCRDRHGGCASYGGYLFVHVVCSPFRSYRVSSWCRAFGQCRLGRIHLTRRSSPNQIRNVLSCASSPTCRGYPGGSSASHLSPPWA